jgi:hypothetical protein
MTSPYFFWSKGVKAFQAFNINIEKQKIDKGEEKMSNS